MKTYPIMLKVHDRLCVVVGAGPLGLRKARALAEGGARVRLVGEEVPPPARTAGMEVIRARYAPAHLTGAFVVMACTGDRQVNAAIAADARAGGALVNVPDDPDQCDFFVPAVARDGDVVLAVGTGGAAPALAAGLRQGLAAHLPGRVGEFAAALEQVRVLVRERAGEAQDRRRILKKLSGEAGYEAFLAGGLEGLLEMAASALEAR